jgi:long-chain acyl-CoA synthetase/crotonobetaine/carnitine-CoA ligase
MPFQAAALAVPDPDRGEEVKLFVVLKPGITKEQLPPSAIVAACADELAVFKLPRYIEYRPIPLPRSATGTKIIKSQLPRDCSGPDSVCWDTKEECWLSSENSLTIGLPGGP